MPIRVSDVLGSSPGDGRYGELIRAASVSMPLVRLDVAVAYATHSGVADLCDLLSGSAAWASARKRWLVGIDHCRSDPDALSHLHSLPRSEVRIHDGAFVTGRHGCPPRVSFHPKLYMFYGRNGMASVVGSGNLSHTGLRVGIEAGVLVRAQERAALIAVSRWYSGLWSHATPYPHIEDAYGREYRAYDNRRRPTPVEDDVVPEDAGTRGQLTAGQLKQLRVCQHLWIEAGNLHLNRGPGRPGNQLMLKRNMRVYFGFQASELAPDTAIGVVAIAYGAHTRPDCSLRFSNNSMDVLTLPLPGAGGPQKYDQEILLFRRTGLRRFELSVARSGDAARWRRESDRIGGLFSMSSGRRWGVF